MYNNIQCPAPSEEDHIRRFVFIRALVCAVHPRRLQTRRCFRRPRRAHVTEAESDSGWRRLTDNYPPESWQRRAQPFRTKSKVTQRFTPATVPCQIIRLPRGPNWIQAFSLMTRVFYKSGDILHSHETVHHVQ